MRGVDKTKVFDSTPFNSKEASEAGPSLPVPDTHTGQAAASPHNTAGDLPPEIVPESFMDRKFPPAENIGPAKKLHNPVVAESGRAAGGSQQRQVAPLITTQHS
ncbi:hypothetical protein E2C01_015458 [Portunus trituberculatus]|uniref:Uncharacterized protein n=1 Tax=Portunus trituberculatus TaxID=210409 RepID=A0A5B7DLK6_PORTR|nr:hypothetical protein [Portunus trituberculatus]